MDEDRLKHSIAVARKMVEIGKEYNLNNDDLQDIKNRYGEESKTYRDAKFLVDKMKHNTYFLMLRFLHI